jgi:hypothetical protein
MTYRQDWTFDEEDLVESQRKPWNRESILNLRQEPLRELKHSI